MKAGDKVIIKATGKEALIVFISTLLENNFYLLTINGFAVRDEQGAIKEFFVEDLKEVDNMIAFLDKHPNPTTSTPKLYKDFTQSEKEAYWLGEQHENERMMRENRYL